MNALIDLGCGNGKTLAEIDDQLGGVPFAMGVDICDPAIAAAKAEFADRPTLEFHCAEGKAFLAEWSKPGTLLLTNAGVLEYWHRKDIAELLGALAAARGTAVFLIEPLAPDYDLKRDTRSVIFGKEQTFSHNYRNLLTEAGFTITHCHEMQAGKFRNILIGGRS